MWIDLLTTLRDNEFARDGLASLVILVVGLGLRSAVLRGLQRTRLNIDEQLRWRTFVRNMTIAFIAIAIVVVWAQELRAVAISVAAIVAALIVATKELLMCLLGSTVRASGGSFRVGDRIEVTGVRGDVLDIGPLTTTILEVGPGQSIHQRTGHRITVPNSVFLLSPVKNETTSNDFVLHVLRVPVSSEPDWRTNRKRLQEIAEARCGGFVEDARKALAQASPSGVGTGLISTEPVVYLEIPEPGKIEFLLRFPAPVRRRGRIAQQILREFLNDSPDAEDDDGGPWSSHAS